ncbi:MAG: hypothetical protein ACXVB9_06545 [Bdellovibrionota bacterium]
MNELLLAPSDFARQSGFDVIEKAGDHAWRWALGGSQQVEFTSPLGAFLFYRFRAPFPDSKLSLKLNGTVVGNGQWEGCLELPAGAVRLELSVSKWNSPQNSFSADQRALAYSVEKFALLPAENFFRRMELVLENHESALSETLCFNILATPASQRWAWLLERLLIENVRLVKHFNFLGWPAAGRSVAFLCGEMNRHIATINAFFASHPTLPYHLGMEFHPDRLHGQDPFNQIHFHFEKLIGQVWNVAPYFSAADKKTKHAICQLNHICHELEAVLQPPGQRGGVKLDIAATVWPPYQRELLYQSDYREFVPALEWGDVFAHYAQPGKSHFQAFEHRDEVVGDSFVNGLRYFSGEFDVHFGPPRDSEEERAEWAEFRAWLNGKGFNPDDPFLSLGHIVVAKLDRHNLPGAVTDHIARFERTFNNIKEIRLYRNDGTTTSRAYSYFWRDADYEEEEINAL